MAIKFKHPIYLSEEQISNLLEIYLQKVYEEAGLPFKILREYQIHSARPDFIIITKNLIEIIEVKQTANWSALRQVCFYKKIIDQHVLSSCFREGKGFPKTIASLYAINFDHEIIDVCWSLDVSLTKVFLKNKTTIDIDDVYDYAFEEVSIDQGLCENLRQMTVFGHV